MSKKNGDIVTFLKQKDYKMINDNLGGGSFGKTVLLQDPFINELFVAKMYKPMYEEIKERYYANFLEEIKILYKLNHPNIVRIYNYYAYEKECTGYILMEYIDGKNIEEYFIDYMGIWEVSSLDQIFIQLINGFSYIENKGIIHRDIREGNILIDNKGNVKIIDFGIGKVFENTSQDDSLIGDINRANSDTLPKEYYEGVYTSKTDMFYLAELFNRMLGLVSKEWMDFTYQDILDKMMKKNPEERYENFAEIRNVIEKRDFISMDITDEDREIYLQFANSLYNSLIAFKDEQKFNYDVNVFVSKLEDVLELNLFETVIQQNADVISSVVCGGYKYNNKMNIQRSSVAEFLEWFRGLTDESKRLVLRNIIAKLSRIRVEISDEELPFN